MPENQLQTVTVVDPGRETGDGITASMYSFLTRGEVAMTLRVSIATVRRLQGKELHPRRTEDGMYLFDPKEVEAVRARRPPPPQSRECQDPGELAAEAFKMFRDGVDVRDVVIALKRPPTEIAALFHQWERMGNALVVSQEVYGQLNRMVGLGLLDAVVLEAIENDEFKPICDYINEAVRAKARRRAQP